MTRDVIKCENEIRKAIGKIAMKYGFKELATTGTIDPAWYDLHSKQSPATPGMSVLFYNHKIK